MSADFEPGSISACLQRLKQGDRDGAQRLWEAYYLRLVRLAAQRVGRSPRRGVDGEDVALSAFKSFVLRAEKGEFPRLDNRDNLWQILFVMTMRKSIDLLRHEKNHCKVVSLEDLADEAGALEPMAAGPTPDLAAQLKEELNRLLDRIESSDPRSGTTLRRIAEWKMEGYTNREIAGRLGVIEQTVERKLRRIRDIWTGEEAP